MEDFVLEYDKCTDNKWRYCEEFDGINFKLYVFKVRTPEPRPGQVKVKISRPGEIGKTRRFTVEELELNPDLRERPIYAELKRDHKRTETVRYNPVDRDTLPGVGETYIPIPMLDRLLPQGEKTKYIAMSVDWL